MTRSESVGQLGKALAKAQLEMQAASKSSVNPHFKSKYAALPEVIEVAKVLNKHGLAFFQPARTEGGSVTVETLLVHGESGEWISEALTLVPQQLTPQGVGSAITYGRRFGLSSLVGICADEDDDGNEASTAKPAPPIDEDKAEAIYAEFVEAFAQATDAKRVGEIATAIKRAHEGRQLTDDHRKKLLKVYGERVAALASKVEAKA